MMIRRGKPTQHSYIPTVAGVLALGFLCFLYSGMDARNGAQRAEVRGNVDPNSALISAVKRYDLETLRMLLEGGANADLRDAKDRALLVAVQMVYPPYTIIYPEDKKNADEKRGERDYWKKVEKQIAVVRELLGAGADVNVADEEGFTPLMHAIMSINKPLTEVLLEAGGDVKAGNVNARNATGETVLTQAILMGDRELVRALLEAGADTSIADSRSGETPLLRAVSRGDRELVSLLLEAGADTSIANNKSGETPLLLAARWGKRELVSALLEAGADVNAVADYGYMAASALFGAAEGAAIIDREVRRAKSNERSYLVMRLLDYLLGSGSDFDSKIKEYASELDNYKEILNMLKESGAKIQNSDWQLLVRRGIKGLDKFTFLLEGASVTPLPLEIKEALEALTLRPQDIGLMRRIHVNIQEVQNGLRSGLYAKKLLDMPIYRDRLQERLVNTIQALDKEDMPKDIIMLVLEQQFGSYFEKSEIEKAIDSHIMRPVEAEVGGLE